MKKVILILGILLILVVLILGMMSYTSNSASYFKHSKIKEIGPFQYEVTPPDEPKPSFTYQKKLKQAPDDAEDAEAKIGDVVFVSYQMVSWDQKGKTVQHSHEFFEEGLPIEAGFQESSGEPRITAFSVPEPLSDILIGAKMGERYELVLPTLTQGMPDEMDKNDAYVLVVDIRKVIPRAEWLKPKESPEAGE